MNEMCRSRQRSLYHVAALCFVVILTLHRAGSAREYEVVLDRYDTDLPTMGWYYNRTGGDRGVLNAEECTYTFDGNTKYTVRATTCTGSWTWGGMWYGPLRAVRDGIPLNADSIFGRFIRPAYQGHLTAVDLVVNSVVLAPHAEPALLKIQCKDTHGGVIAQTTFAALATQSYPTTFTLALGTPGPGEIGEVTWVLDQVTPDDSITVDRFSARVQCPELAVEEEAFLWTTSWLLSNWDPITGIVDDRSNFTSGSMQNISATAKLAKIVCYAARKGYIDQADATAIVTKIADSLLNTVPRGPAGRNQLWPHFTRWTPESGVEALPPHDEYDGTEWSSGDTCYAALDLLVALQMIGDPQIQIPAVETFLKEIDWDDLLMPDNSIGHGYAYDGAKLTSSWKGFGMETVGVMWARASATGRTSLMLPPPTDNGSGFIMHAHYPMVLRGTDRWGNDWDSLRASEASLQAGWYCDASHSNSYLCGAGLFGLSAAETPEAFDPASALKYAAYGTGGSGAPEDGDREVVALHYCGMISQLRPADARGAWQTLRDSSAAFLAGRTILSPLNCVESMRVSRSDGACTVNWLKGSWNLALGAEGWAMADVDIATALANAIETNEFLRHGLDILTTTTAAQAPWQCFQ